MIELKNLFTDVPGIFGKVKDEITTELVSGYKTKIEEIVSPIGFQSQWQNSGQEEFVALLRGRAELVFENGQIRKMEVGDYMTIPAHTKHRVEMVRGKRPAVWLTVYYQK